MDCGNLRPDAVQREMNRTYNTTALALLLSAPAVAGLAFAALRRDITGLLLPFAYVLVVCETWAYVRLLRLSIIRAFGATVVGYMAAVNVFKNLSSFLWPFAFLPHPHGREELFWWDVPMIMAGLVKATVVLLTARKGTDGWKPVCGAVIVACLAWAIGVTAFLEVTRYAMRGFSL